MAIVKIPGVLFDFNGRKLVLAPLTLGPLRQLLGALKEFGTGNDPRHLDTAADAVTASLQRNYPHITQEQVENELLDAGNIWEVVPIISNQSGLVRTTDDGQELQPGEAPAALITGSSSTPT